MSRLRGHSVASGADACSASSIFLKPAGPTSARVVARVRRIYAMYGGDRHIAAGHLGTLDPQAAGVLPVAIGKATRLDSAAGRSAQERTRARSCSAVRRRRKTHRRDRRSEAPFPPTGRALRTKRCRSSSASIAQVPPMYSAAHHQGKRLYELAREGKTSNASRAALRSTA